MRLKSIILILLFLVPFAIIGQPLSNPGLRVQAAGAGPSYPTLGQPIIWYQPSGMTITTGEVTAWANDGSAGSAWDQSNTGVTDEPDEITSCINGYTCADFNGSDEWLMTSDGLATYVDTAQEWTCFAVCYMNADPATNITPIVSHSTCCHNDGFNGMGPFVVGFGTGPIIRIDAVNDPNEQRDFVEGGTTLSTATWYVLTAYVTYNGSDSVACRINGAHDGATVLTASRTNVTDGRSDYGLTMGRRFNGTGYFNGRLVELLFYSRGFTSSEMTDQEDELATKYNISF